MEQKVKLLKWENFESQFHESWHQWVKPIITSEKFATDFAQLRILGKQGQRIIPSSDSGNLFRIFREVPYDKLTVVVVGLSPYNIYKDGKEVANGAAMCCANPGAEQPTLTQWYNAMQKSFGNDIVRDPDLSYLTRQGVFLYNFSLTCAFKDATSHIPIWEWFSKQLFFTAISDSGVPVITLGKEAAKVTECCAMPWQPVFNLKHPASASYSKTDWDDEGAFKTVESMLHKKNIPFTWVIKKEIL